MIRDTYGRPLDDFDALRLRIAAQQIVDGRSFSIESEDGRPMTGFTTGRGEPSCALIAIGWRADADNQKERDLNHS